MVESSPEQGWMDRPGGVFLRRADLMPAEDRTLLARCRARGDGGADGALREQLKRTAIPFEPARPAPAVPKRAAAKPRPARSQRRHRRPARDVQRHRRVCRRRPANMSSSSIRSAGTLPPPPGSNVVANPTFGFAATESSPGYTWSGNSHDNRLTPWSNDPVRDPAGEVLFIRDEESGAVLVCDAPSGGRRRCRTSCATPGRKRLRTRARGHRLEPVAVRPSHRRREGVQADAAERFLAAATLFRHALRGLGARENIARDRTCTSSRPRPRTGALLARNRFRQEFAERVAFLDLSPGDRRTVTGDRTEFIGRNGTLARPAALERESLSNRVGAALDPCGAVQITLVLQPREERTVTGLLGDADTLAEAGAIIQRHRLASGVAQALDGSRRYWDSLLTTVQVRTPDRSLDLMLNRWLLYQTLSCRIWGRSGFYQSSGAYGFRDQLQDTLALLFAAPHLTREQLLRCGVAAVRGRGRAALVARTLGPRRPHAIRRRSAVAAICSARVREDDRRLCRIRRKGLVPDRPHSEPGRTRGLRTARTEQRRHIALRPLRACDRGQHANGRSRPAVDGRRRLERRHEHGRHRAARGRASGSPGS